MINFSAVNPSYPNSCANETITGITGTPTESQFNSNQIAKKFQAHMNETCAQRGFTVEGMRMQPMVFHPTSTTTVNWNGQVWTR